jgi:hypothetical protein
MHKKLAGHPVFFSRVLPRGRMRDKVSEHVRNAAHLRDGDHIEKRV